MSPSLLDKVMHEVTAHMHEPIIEEGTVQGMRHRAGGSSAWRRTYPPAAAAAAVVSHQISLSSNGND
jgi:hypothetical protein